MTTTDLILVGQAVLGVILMAGIALPIAVLMRHMFWKPRPTWK